MKQWVRKLMDQFGMDWDVQNRSAKSSNEITEDRATLLYIIDTYGKYLMDLEGQPVRKIREVFDEFAKGLLNSDEKSVEKTLFRLRQFFSSYRIDEYSYIQNTFDDFKNIVWDFADQLCEDLKIERAQDKEIASSLEDLKEAVESNAIDDLRVKSREFIDFYIELQTRRDMRRSNTITTIQNNLDLVKKKLIDANQSARTDHLTGAYNRKSFDEQMRMAIQSFAEKSKPTCLIMMDIDFFKRINDVYGHDTGDYVLKECVRLLKETFSRETDFIARIGGEEFAVILPDFKLEDAIKKAEQIMASVRKEVILHMDSQIKFTLSLGIAQLLESERADAWLKRADQALYESKNSGRDRYSLANHTRIVENVA